MRLGLREVFAATLVIVSAGTTVATYVFVLRRLGAGPQMDGLLATFVVSTVLLSVFSAAIVNIVTPVLLEFGDEDRASAAREILVRLGLIAGVPAALLVLLSAQVSQILFPGFDSIRHHLVKDLAPFAALSLWAGVVSAVFTAYLRAEHRYLAPDAVAVLVGLAILIALDSAMDRFGVAGAAGLFAFRTIGGVLGIGAACWPRLTRSRALRKVPPLLPRLAPMLSGGSVHKLGPLIDSYLLSLTAPGVLTVYSVLGRAAAVVIQAFERVVVMPWVPRISESLARADNEALLSQYRDRLLASVLLLLAGFVLVGLFGRPAAFWLLDGSSGSSVVDVAFQIGLALVGVVFGAGLGQCAAAPLYASGHTRQVARATAVSFLISVPAKFALFNLLGGVGVALGASVQYVLMFVILHRQTRVRFAGNQS
jgi:peptidoglycan biosynthesis protein MviN/MurJ (putative lipid II flippase)